MVKFDPKTKDLIVSAIHAAKSAPMDMSDDDEVEEGSPEDLSEILCCPKCHFEGPEAAFKPEDDGSDHKIMIKVK